MTDQPPIQKTWGGRFRGAASDLMTRINASIGFDKRLWREDIAASKAHASMLRDQGIIAAADAAATADSDPASGHSSPVAASAPSSSSASDLAAAAGAAGRAAVDAAAEVTSAPRSSRCSSTGRCTATR